LAAVATTTVVMVLGLVRRLFSPDHRLLPLTRRSDDAPKPKRANRSTT
jgi:putative ABC transport system permease protein